MFDSYYHPCTLVNKARQGSPDESFVQYCYRFDDENGDRYLIYLNKYPSDFFTIEFFLRKDKDTKDRFKFLTGKNKAAKVINTALAVIGEKIGANSDRPISFGFIGAREWIRKKKVRSLNDLECESRAKCSTVSIPLGLTRAAYI